MEQKKPIKKRQMIEVSTISNSEALVIARAVEKSGMTKKNFTKRALVSFAQQVLETSDDKNGNEERH